MSDLISEKSVDVLIVDDHELMCNALTALLEHIKPQWRTQQLASGRDIFAQLAGNNNVQLILLDLFMPEIDGFELIEKVVTRYPIIPIVTVSASEDPIHIQKALDLGSRAYITKSSPSDVIAQAIKTVLAGGKYLPLAILNSSVTNNNQSIDMDNKETTSSEIRGKLTERQLQIFYLLGQGKSNKEIARDLFISANTVKIHVSAILHALSLKNRAQTGIVSKMLQEKESFTNNNH